MPVRAFSRIPKSSSSVNKKVTFISQIKIATKTHQKAEEENGAIYRNHIVQYNKGQDLIKLSFFVFQ